MIEVLDIEQRSPEWYAARLGIPTASEFGAILAKGQGKMRRSYLTRLAAERLTGEAQERYSNHHMARGREQEEEALASYAWLNEVELQRVGLIRLWTPGGWVGYSPDALVGADGTVEVKTRLPALMVDAMLYGATEHAAQIQGGLWITSRAWCDLVLYHPDLNLLTIRIERDEAYIATLADEVCKFAVELHDAVQRLRGGSPSTILRQQLEASL